MVDIFDMKIINSTRSDKVTNMSLLAAMLWALLMLAAPPNAHAEYADVVINNYSDKAKVRPVIFPHWIHRIKYTCKVCHAGSIDGFTGLGISLKAGGNDITMAKLKEGKFCGACHNGEISFGLDKCNLCHSAKPGTPTQTHESTIQPHMLIPLQLNE